MNSKSERLQLRCTPSTAALLREAAEAQGQDLTSFVVGAAVDRARQVVAEDRMLRLSSDDIQLLGRTLTQNGAIPQLTRLFQKVDEAGRNKTSTH